MSDTWLLEDRVIGTALDTGELVADIGPTDFLIAENANLYTMMSACYRDMGTCLADVFSDWLTSTSGMELRSVVMAKREERVPPGARLEVYVTALKRAGARARLDEVINFDLPQLDLMRGDPEQVREQAVKALQSIVTQSPRNRVRALKPILKDVLEEMQRRFESGGLPGVPTGMPTLDTLTGGWQCGDLNLLAARPGVGKTALALNFMLAAAQAGKSVGFISAEQPAEQIAQRLIAIAGRVDAWKLRSPSGLREEQWAMVTAGLVQLQDLPITIADDPSPTIERVMNYGRVMESDLIILDYAQRVKGPGTIYERVSAVAMGLKEMARSLSIPVLALAQINRAGDGNAKMSNLKGSGDLEQEADSILILERNDDDKQVATLTLEKNRHGPVGQINLRFNAACMHFGEAAQ
jgi:replicative DNA helicase